MKSPWHTESQCSARVGDCDQSSGNDTAYFPDEEAIKLYQYTIYGNIDKYANSLYV